VRIPNGDLAPARRRGYSYGRRRSRRNRRVGLLVVLLLAAGGAGYYALQRDDANAPSRLAQRPVVCPTPSASAAPAKPLVLPRPQQVRVALLNGTSRNGLAKNIGDQLAAQGFVVTAQANAPAALGGASQVAYAHGAEAAAQVARQWVIGAVAVQDAKVPRGTVRITRGSDFHRLATPAEAAAALRSPSVVPTATPAPVVSGCPS
jgi:hypothetical protein